MLSKIIQFFLKFPKITLSFSLAFCLFFAFFSKNLSVDASAQSLLLEHDEDLKFYREISSRYGGDDFLMLAFTPKDVDLFSQKNLNFIKNISEEIAQIKGVKQVFSIANAPLLQS
ncbi:RND family transporter, partial [Campylobacter volucris]|nr:RND family transporter [Campylobacter volucris]